MHLCISLKIVVYWYCSVSGDRGLLFLLFIIIIPQLCFMSLLSVLICWCSCMY